LKLRVSSIGGYIDSATAQVTVVDKITVDLPAKIGLCKTDKITLQPVSDGLDYVWTESGGGTTLDHYNIKNPVASPVADSTTYYVTANWGTCMGTAQTTVFTSPYPKAAVSADTFICFKGTVPLHGTMTGASYTWSPDYYLQNANTLDPIAIPNTSTRYQLSVTDTFYCKKPAIATVLVKVIDSFTIDAGKDKKVGLASPFQLFAAGGDTSLLRYVWQPQAYFNNNKVVNPVAIINSPTPDLIRFTVQATTREGCTASDDVLIKVYNMPAGILVPTAFTPNNDGLNDVLKPVLIGMDRLDFFSIYNRYGQLIYTTSEMDNGWDGTVKGIQQNGGVYVFIAQGKDYIGKTVFKKGTVVLIR
jgi:gliding motility-associated-like protein